MQTLEQRIRDHAIAAGMLPGGCAINSYVAEAAAWVADICASALDASADLRAVAAEASETMRHAGASRSEEIFVQLVVAEVEAVAHRLSGRDGVDLPEAIRAKFRWTERADAGLTHVVGLRNVGELSELDRKQAKAIYLTSMLRTFGNKPRAFRAWALWHGAPRSREARPWAKHHAYAQLLAFAGLDVQSKAAVYVRFELDH
jgi:hypothetical protein